MAARPAGLVATALLALAAAAAACVGPDGERRVPLPGQLASVESDRERGYAFDQALREHLPQIEDLVVLEFVGDLGQRLVDDLGDQPFDYRFRVIPDASLNAFAVPGGFIYFHSGTILGANSVEELAGVLAHELGHVKGRHSARMAQDAAIPGLLMTLAGVAAAAATGEAAPLIAAQAANVAIQLQYSRQYEDEADRMAVDFLARSGLRSEGLVRFFERIQMEQRRLPPGQIPPYLYSHPQVESRIAVVRQVAEEFPVGAPPTPELEHRFREVQGRLAWLTRHGRATAPANPNFDRAVADPALADATRLLAAERPADALAALDRAESASPEDPRVPFRRAEILEADGRLDEAIYAYRRAVHLDPHQTATLLALGRAHRAAGNRREALFFLEQASYRAGAQGRARVQIDAEIERLSFPIVLDSGFATGDATRERDTLVDSRETALPAGASRLAWWARIGPHWRDRAGHFRVRWVDGAGERGDVESPDRPRGLLIAKKRVRGDDDRGPWTLELLFGDDVVHSETLAAPR